MKILVQSKQIREINFIQCFDPTVILLSQNCLPHCDIMPSFTWFDNEVIGPPLTVNSPLVG